MQLPSPACCLRPTLRWPSSWKRKRVPAPPAAAWAAWVACQGWICKSGPDFRRELEHRANGQSGATEGCRDDPFSSRGGSFAVLGDPQPPTGVGLFLSAAGRRMISTPFEPGGKTTEAAVSIRVMPAGLEKSPHDDAQFPSLSFFTRHYNKTVCIQSSNAIPQSGGPAGPRGDYQLAQIDEDLVKVELLKLIVGIVNR